jgi:glucose-6-phosphate isomerase
MLGDEISLFEPRRCVFDAVRGALAGSTRSYTKRLAQLAGLYGDEAAYATALATMGDETVYEVTEFRPSTKPGDLIFGVTRMVPGKIGREYFMTRGHIHAKVDRSEMYYGQGGHGLMLIESPVGETRIVEIAPQTVCYVPPLSIHRAVNTGSEDFLMLFCYPADAGQDYDIIGRAGGMRSRILDDGNGGWTEAPNAKYAPRPAGEVARLLEACRHGVGE